MKRKKSAQDTEVQVSSAANKHDRFERLKRATAPSGETSESSFHQRMDELLSYVVHELKTPLTVIKGNVQLTERHLLRHRQQPEVLPDYLAEVALLQVINQQVDRVNTLLSNLLDVSRIQAEKIEICAVPCDLVNLVRRAVLSSSIKNSGREIRPGFSESLVVPVRVDALKIEQVLIHYLTNAIQYSSADTPIDIGIQHTDSLAYCFVRDAGIGIDSQQLEHIWDCFFRGEEAHKYTNHGSGLGVGLYISKTIIEQHQGQVGVQSKPGEGSTVWFTLPIDQNLTQDIRNFT